MVMKNKTAFKISLWEKIEERYKFSEKGKKKEIRRSLFG